MTTEYITKIKKTQLKKLLKNLLFQKLKHRFMYLGRIKKTPLNFHSDICDV